MATRRMPGRSCFQYFTYRLPGNRHRSLLRRPDRRSHQSPNRQLRHQPGRQRVGQALYRGPDRPRVLAHQLQLALRAGHRRVHGALCRPGAGRDRHPRPGAPSAHQRRHARRDLDDRIEHRRPRREGQKHQQDGRHRSGQRGLHQVHLYLRSRRQPQPDRRSASCQLRCLRRHEFASSFTWSPTTSASSTTFCAC